MIEQTLQILNVTKKEEMGVFSTKNCFEFDKKRSFFGS